MKQIGFIGAGNMATAIIKGLIAQNGSAAGLGVFDTDPEKCALMAQNGVRVFASTADLVQESDIIVLAVKPQSYAAVLAAVKPVITNTKTVVSIAAGISIGSVRTALGCDCPMVRVMPNTPLLLKKGATALCPSENIGAEDRELVYRMFAAAGFECPAILEDTRKLIFENEALGIRYFLVKPSDVTVYVEHGASDVGIVGKDILLEKDLSILPSTVPFAIR